MNKLHTFLSLKNLDYFIEKFINDKSDFELQMSSFSAKIKTKESEFIFTKNIRNKYFFLKYNELISNLNPISENVNYDFIKYYDTGFNKNEYNFDFIYQVDIKNCYPSILLNNNIISNKIYDSFQSLNKKDRLALIGMLAKRKNVFKFEKGIIVEFYEDKNKNSDYFFYCVQKTYQIISEIKSIIQSGYLFSWVDAIYFTQKSDIKLISDFLNDKYNLSCSVCELKKFSCILNKNHYKLKYIKNNEDITMNVPLIYNNEKTIIKNYLLNKKYEQE